jgi:hypothetical protein
MMFQAEVRPGRNPVIVVSKGVASINEAAITAEFAP